MKHVTRWSPLAILRSALVIPSLLLMIGAPLTASAKPAKRRAPPRAAAPATPSPSNAAATPAIEDRGEPDAAPAAAEIPPAPPPRSRTPIVAANEAANDDASKPSPPPPPAAPPARQAPSVDLEKLRADYDRLRDELFRARSRAQVVEESLWKSKLSASFRWKGGPGYLVHHASVRLDGAEIWDSGDKAVTDDLVTVAERAIKAGPHALTLRIEIRPGKKSKDSDRLGYVSEHTFAIIVPEDRRTQITITGDEDGDAPEYEPEIEVEVENRK